MVVRFLGRGLAGGVPVLARLNIRAPVIGGGLVAIHLAASRYFGPAAPSGAPAPPPKS